MDNSYSGADHETTQALRAAAFERISQDFIATVAECSVVFLSDYAKGTLNGAHAAEFIAIARAAGKLVIVDPKGLDFTRYRGATLIKPNLTELADATGMPVSDTTTQNTASRKLLDITGAAVCSAHSWTRRDAADGTQRPTSGIPRHAQGKCTMYPAQGIRLGPSWPQRWVPELASPTLSISPTLPPVLLSGRWGRL